jgi:hypothetical protein
LTIADEIAAHEAAVRRLHREQTEVRPRLTAKGYRAIGVPIPAHITDDTVIDLVVER